MKKFANVNDPLIPTTHHAQLVELCVSRGVDRDELLAGTGLTADLFHNPEARISLSSIVRLVKNALRLTEDPGLGLDFGRLLPISGLGMIGYALMSSATLAQAIEVALRFYPAVILELRLDYRVEGDIAVLDIVEELPQGKLRAYTNDSMVVLMHEIGRFAVGRPLPFIDIAVSHPEPAYRARYDEFFKCPLYFGAPVTRLRMEAHALQWPLLYASPTTAKLALQQCESLLLPLAGGDSVVRQVRASLELESGVPPDMRELAKRLQTSERSLRRALSEYGTSYKQLLDEVRQRRATDYLRSTSLSMDEIADALGFGSARAFRRAVRRWTGMSAQQIRGGQVPPS